MPSPRLGALLLAAAFGLGSVAAFPGVAGATPLEEACFLASVNAARSAGGIPPLVLSASFSTVARAHSQQMAAVARLSHNTDLPNQAPANWVAIGENVGEGPSCGAVVQLMAGDPPHRANLLDPSFDTVGVGVVDAAGGVLYVTEDLLGTGAAGPAAAVPGPTANPAVVPVPVRLAAPAAGTDPARSQVVRSKGALPPAGLSRPAGGARGTARGIGQGAGKRADTHPSGGVQAAVPIVGDERSPPRGMLGAVVLAISTFFEIRS